MNLRIVLCISRYLCVCNGPTVDNAWKVSHALAELLKSKGNKALAGGNTDLAMIRFTEGLKVAMSLANNEQQIVTLLTNCSHNFYFLF